MKWLLGTLALLGLIGNANAAIYKCVKNGKTTYSEEPCSGKVEVLELQDNTVSSEHLRVKSNEIFNNDTVEITNGNTTTIIKRNLMNKVDIDNRIRELELDIKSDNSSFEKVSISRRELSIMKGTPRALSTDKEKERGNWRRLLNSDDPVKRRKAVNELNRVFTNY